MILIMLDLLSNLPFGGQCCAWLQASLDQALTMQSRHGARMFTPNQHTWSCTGLGLPAVHLQHLTDSQHCVMRSLGEPLEIEHCRPVTLTYITHLLLDRLLQHLATLSHTNDQVQMCIVLEYIFDFPDCKEHLGCCVTFWNYFFQQTMTFTWTLIVLFHSSHFEMSEEVKHRCNYQHYTVHFISYWDT